MSYAIKDAISSDKVPCWGNKQEYIAIHYLGVVGQNHDLVDDGCGAHFYIYWDGTIWQRCSLDAVPWAVGTAGYYKQIHPKARNRNTISIEMCCKCDGDARNAEDKKWYFTRETQEACVWLVKKLMKELNIPADHVLRHYDIVNKTCPAPYVHNNKYRTSWTWEEFKEKLKDTGNTMTKIKKTKIDDTTVEEISKVVYGEAGVIRSRDALLAVAQCIHDMWCAGGYGKTVKEVMQNNFAAYGNKNTTNETRQAVYDVFVNGTRRFPDARLLQFRSFANYSDGKGNMDAKKCASLLVKYKYLGKDAFDNRWGHFYFGYPAVQGESSSSAPQYRVQCGSFASNTRANNFATQIKEAGFDAIVKIEDGKYKVQCGSFAEQSNAEGLVQKLKDAGFASIIKKC